MEMPDGYGRIMHALEKLKKKNLHIEEREPGFWTFCDDRISSLELMKEMAETLERLRKVNENPYDCELTGTLLPLANKKMIEWIDGPLNKFKEWK